MKIVLLGGYGIAGRAIAQRILLMPNMAGGSIVIAGRDSAVAHDFASRLMQNGAPCTVTGAYADATDIGSLIPLFQDASLAFLATSAVDALEPAMRAALLTGTDFYDILLSSPEKTALLARTSGAVTSKNLCFITDGGYHPGLPGALIRYAAARLPGIKRAHVYGSFNVDWTAYEPSMETQLSFFRDLCRSDFYGYYEKSRWIAKPKTRRHDFDDPVGPRYCVPLALAEIQELPSRIPSLDDAGFWISGFGPKADLIMTALGWGGRLWPRQEKRLARYLWAALRRYAVGGAWARLDMIARTDTARLSLSLDYDDAYDLTALSVVACLDQYFKTRKTGLWTQAGFVDPVPYIRALSYAARRAELILDGARTAL